MSIFPHAPLFGCGLPTTKYVELGRKTRRDRNKIEKLFCWYHSPMAGLICYGVGICIHGNISEYEVWVWVRMGMRCGENHFVWQMRHETYMYHQPCMGTSPSVSQTRVCLSRVCLTASGSQIFWKMFLSLSPVCVTRITGRCGWLDQRWRQWYFFCNWRIFEAETSQSSVQV